MTSGSLPVSSSQLDLKLTLESGQAFLWKPSGEEKWTGPIGNRLFTVSRTTPNEVQYHVTPSCEDAKSILEDYFRLDVDVTSLYSEWSERDIVFASRCSTVNGVRLLRQDPLETLIAFICSSNNNIKRIQQMMSKLCATYGDSLGCHGDQHFYNFPSLEGLKDCEATLNTLGFGYRSKFISKTTALLYDQLGGVEWLHSLKELPYKEAWKELQQLPGVGAKVADCVCLMGLEKLEAVPVDRHIMNMAVRCYGAVQPTKTLTANTYQSIGNYFRCLFPTNAGWAQAVLFTSELYQSKESRKRPHTLSSQHQTPKKQKTSTEIVN